MYWAGNGGLPVVVVAVVDRTSAAGERRVAVQVLELLLDSLECHIYLLFLRVFLNIRTAERQPHFFVFCETAKAGFLP